MGLIALISGQQDCTQLRLLYIKKDDGMSCPFGDRCKNYAGRFYDSDSTICLVS